MTTQISLKGSGEVFDFFIPYLIIIPFLILLQITADLVSMKKNYRILLQMIYPDD
jgi:hypothetical protein